MTLRPQFRNRPNRPGVAATELAILLPFLCFLFVLAIDFGRIFYVSITIENCARNGAFYACTDPTAANDSTSISTVAKKDAGNLTASKVTVSSSTNSSTNPTTATITVSYPFTTITTYPGVPHTLTISRTVKVNVSPWTPN